jgi:hypothetical protein
MAEKPSPPRTQQKRRPADRLTGGTSKNQIELAEEDLKKISGGNKCLKIEWQP